MKNKITFIFAVLGTLTLAACDNKELRKDISDFVANFSLEGAVEQYKKVKMEKVIDVNDAGKLSKQVETITFDVTNVETPEYRHVADQYEGEMLVNTSESYLLYEGDKIYLIENEKKEVTLEEAHNLIQRFFYTITDQSGTLHDGGYYYGDIIINSAYYYQNSITIDENEKTLTWVRNFTDKGVENQTTTIVDEVGMLKSKTVKSEKGNQMVTTTINIQQI